MLAILQVKGVLWGKVAQGCCDRQGWGRLFLLGCCHLQEGQPLQWARLTRLCQATVSWQTLWMLGWMVPMVQQQEQKRHLWNRLEPGRPAAAGRTCCARSNRPQILQQSSSCFKPASRIVAG